VIIEEQKIVLIEFINQQGLKLPKNLKQKLAQSDNNPLPTSATGKLKQQQQLQQQKVNLLMKQSTKISGNKGYAEEVDVEEILLPKNYQYNIYGDSASSALQKNTSNNNSSKQRSSVQSSYNQDTDDQEQEEEDEEEEDHHDEDSNYRHYEEEEVYDQVNHNSSGTSTKPRSLLPPGEIFNRLSDNLKSGFPSSSGGSSSRKNNQLANSWNNLRSSKSSARYSSTSMEDDEPAADDDDHDNIYDMKRNNNGSSSRPGTATASSSSAAALPQPPRYEELVNNANKKFSVTDTNISSNRGIIEEIDYEKLQEMQAIRRESPRNINNQVVSSSGGKPGNNGYLSYGQMKSFSPNSSGNQGANNIQGNPYLASASADQRAVGSSQQQNQPESGNGTNRSEEVRPDGTRVIRYRNGTSKELHPNGKSLVKFTNGDTKLTEASSGKVIYFYSQANTSHTTYPDGLELFQFPNGQVIH
jgi:hypothetical protein